MVNGVHMVCKDCAFEMIMLLLSMKVHKNLFGICVGVVCLDCYSNYQKLALSHTLAHAH